MVSHQRHATVIFTFTDKQKMIAIALRAQMQLCFLEIASSEQGVAANAILQVLSKVLENPSTPLATAPAKMGNALGHIQNIFRRMQPTKICCHHRATNIGAMKTRMDRVFGDHHSSHRNRCITGWASVRHHRTSDQRRGPHQLVHRRKNSFYIGLFMLKIWRCRIN